MSQEKVFPIAGHHLEDPGAVYNGRKESEEMMCFRDLVLKSMIKKGHTDFEADKDSETNTVFQSRIKPNRTDVIIDNHANASSNPKATGVEVFVSNNAGANSKAMAKELVDGLAKIYGITNRGIKNESQTARGKIGILNKPGVAVLIEHFFISNPSDLKAFDDNKVMAVEFVAEIAIKYDKLIN